MRTTSRSLGGCRGCGGRWEVLVVERGDRGRRS